MIEKKTTFHQCLICGGVLVLTTMLALALFSVGIRIENIFMLYTIGILIIILETKKYLYGVISSILMVAIYNYLFTEPRFTFHINDKNYIISIVIFLIVSMIVSSLSIRVQKQMEALENAQKVSDTMYKITSGYLHVSGVRQVARYGLECLEQLRKGEYILFVNDFKTDKRVPYSNTNAAIGEDVREAVEWCFHQSYHCGRGTEDYSRISYYMMPVVSKGVTYGVLAVKCLKKPIIQKEKKTLEGVTSIIAVVLDREQANMMALSEKEENQKK